MANGWLEDKLYDHVSSSKSEIISKLPRLNFSCTNEETLIKNKVVGQTAIRFDSFIQQTLSTSSMDTNVQWAKQRAAITFNTDYDGDAAQNNSRIGCG